MSDYPNTEQVRSVFAVDGIGSYSAANAARFDRWLAARDAEVRRLAFMEIVNGASLPDDCVAAIRADEREKAANDYERVIGHAGLCYANEGGSCGCGVQAVRHIILTGTNPYSAAVRSDWNVHIESLRHDANCGGSHE